MWHEVLRVFGPISTIASIPTCITVRSLSPLAGRGGASRRPAHQVVDAMLPGLHESEPAVEPHRRIELLDMDRDRLPGHPRLVEEIVQHRGSEALPAMLGQEGDVDDAVLALPAHEVEAADRLGT